MAEDWTRQEVEAIVADYFDMLDKQVKGIPYNKSEHRRLLLPLLGGRSEGSVERKHQNITAILNDLRFPATILGYKPLRNYQGLLFDVVSAWFGKSHALVSAVDAQIREPAEVPSVEDILASMVDPPTPSPHLSRDRLPIIRERGPKYRVDYLAREAGNKSLGTAGEQFVLKYEKARLIFAGRDALAERVEHVSAQQGDGAGFDILSFGINGREHYIEVKTTAYGSTTPFFVTRNELDVSRKVDADYYLYRAFEFRTRPRLFRKQGSLDHSFNLDPSEYSATLS